MRPLEGTVALVTGASRGVGKGIAVGLGEAGATVYITGRTAEEGRAAVPLSGNVHATADEVTRAGGRGIAVVCDHTDDEQTRAVFARIAAEQNGRLDVLVNNVWGGYEFYRTGESRFWEERGFWDAPFSRFDRMFTAGVRAHYVCAALAAPLMIARGAGLIVNVSYHASKMTMLGVAYGAAKAADDHMAACMAHELAPHRVTAVALWPGLVRTEAVLAAAEHFDLGNSESPRLQGRAVAALAADPDRARWAGRTLYSAELAVEYGFTDEDGTVPRSVRVEWDPAPEK
jgi:NAD(P)-dependent dehydrogenase (short-subunit alcohol dehydrogenase family)